MNMRLQAPILFAGMLVLSAAKNLVGRNSDLRSECEDYASQKCGALYKEPPWTEWFKSCMLVMWQASTTNCNCPYRQLNCQCYNGCVADQWREVKDVGQYCKQQCAKFPDQPICPQI
ncbi:hypothetical protein V8E36_001699 [Tilletia maclaganii]